MNAVRFLTSASVALLIVCVLSPAAHANLITNGSFEANACTGSGLGYKLGLSGNAVTGWFIPASDGVYPWCLQNVNLFGAGPAADGNQWLVLGETGAGGPSMVDRTIQQTMTGLTAGNTYHLSFAIASETNPGASVAQVSFLSGSSTGPATFTAPAASCFNCWKEWGTRSMDFLATSSSVTLQFKDLAVEFPSGNDLGLDAVDVEPLVPEPSYTLLLAPALLGLYLLRRRREVA